jgi:hypothetical protein
VGRGELAMAWWQFHSAFGYLIPAAVAVLALAAVSRSPLPATLGVLALSLAMVLSMGVVWGGAGVGRTVPVPGTAGYLGDAVTAVSFCTEEGLNPPAHRAPDRSARPGRRCRFGS